jgi:hypothetical protein
MRNPVRIYPGEGDGWSITIDHKFWQTPRKHGRYFFVWHYWPGKAEEPFVNTITILNKRLLWIWKEKKI